MRYKPVANSPTHLLAPTHEASGIRSDGSSATHLVADGYAVPSYSSHVSNETFVINPNALWRMPPTNCSSDRVYSGTVIFENLDVILTEDKPFYQYHIKTLSV